MDRQPLREVTDGCFRAGVSRDLCQRGVCVHGGDIQNTAALLLHHVPGKHLRGKKRPLEVELEDKVYAACIQIEESLLAFRSLMLELVIRRRAGIVAACAVDQDVTGTKVRHDLIMHRLQDFRIQHVRLVALTDKSFLPALLCQFLNGLFIQIQRSHFCACLRKSSCHIAAEHAACTGHHDYFTCKINIQREIHHCFFHPFYNNFMRSLCICFLMLTV